MEGNKDNFLSLADIDISKYSNSDEERVEDNWNELIAQIQMGNVIPVIGPDLLTEDESGQNYHQILINKLAHDLKVTSNPTSFSQLVYDSDFLNKCRKIDAIYKYLDILKNAYLPFHPLLVRLLQTKRFPFVITTSFTPVVENCMRQIFGQDNVNVLQFNNDSQRSMRVGFGDIQNEKELRKPTVFYMFGKVCAEPHRYVVTDLDMMEFCKTWLTGMGIPRNLVEHLKKRYLLFMGSSYSDWLFRFIWFSLRHNSVESQSSSMFVVDTQDSNLGSFERFLERLEAFTQHDPEAVISQIEQRLLKIDENQDCYQLPKEEFTYDVFLSYSRTDSDAATFLYDQLRQKGISVWFDKHSIEMADTWRNVILSGIRQSKLFVPLLTNNIAQEYLIPHEYREEWIQAAEIAKRLGGRAFIIPVAESGFDFYDPKTKLPDQFKDINAAMYESTNDLIKVADVIERKLEELKNELIK